jgi:hypothetical protein
MDGGDKVKNIHTSLDKPGRKHTRACKKLTIFKKCSKNVSLMDIGNQKTRSRLKLNVSKVTPLKELGN